MRRLYSELAFTNTRASHSKVRILACVLSCFLLGCSARHANFSVDDCLAEMHDANQLPDFSAVGDGKTKVDSLKACEYFCRFKNAVLSGQKTVVSHMVKYPLRPVIDKNTVLIKTEKEFIQHYDSIINSWVKKALMDQEVLKLWASWQGVIVGKGEVWINKDKDGELKVVAILNWPNVWITK